MGTNIDISNPGLAIKSWVELYTDKMFTWAFYKTSHKEVAEDLVQDTFVAAYESIHKFEGKSDPQTWLFSILKNKIAAHYRRIYQQPIINESEYNSNNKDSLNIFFDEIGNWRKEQEPKDWKTDEGELLDDGAFVKVLGLCMGKLPANWEAAIKLKFLEEKKGEEICQELEITTTNFWQILHRAKLNLRKCLELNWFKK